VRVLVARPVSAALLAVATLVLVWPAIAAVFRARPEASRP
jgi:TctA family transporter